MKMNRFLNILIVFSLVVLISVFVLVKYNEHNSYKIQQEFERQDMLRRIPDDSNSITVLSSDENTEKDDYTVLSYSEFLKNYKRTSHYSGTTYVEYRFKKKLHTSENVYLLSFKMRSESTAAQVKVNFGNEHVFYISPTWHEYYFPCSANNIESIKWTLETDFQKTYLSDVKVVKHSKIGLAYNNLKAGTYTVPEIPKQNFAENAGLGVGVSMDVTGDGKYLYSAGNEKLTISEITTTGTQVVSVLEGIGNIRHLKLRDSNTIAIASRENGVFLVDVTDKTNPVILSFYDSLEIANDVCFSGNYMFVASRYFGVEIVDISDLTAPKWINTIVNEEECYRCITGGNYLFVGCWSSGAVRIYDISKLNKPNLVSTINVDGRCAGMTLDGTTLYIASGYKDSKNAENAGDIGYATGNGVAIYDISEIKRPEWCATIKAEGGLFGNGYDDWSVQVSGGYVYFTNSFGGLYVYNVEDIYNPIPVTTLQVPIYPSSSKFVDYSKTVYVFPYNVEEYLLSPVMGVYVHNGCVYFACAYNDVYCYPFEPAVFNEVQSSGHAYTVDSASNKSKKDYEYILSDYDVNTVAEYNDNMYLAAAGEGLVLFDTAFTVLDVFKTEHPVKDVKVSSEGVVVTAEGSCVSTYKVSDNKIIRYGAVESAASSKNVSAIGLTGDGKFAIVQSSWTKIEAVDLEDISNPTLVTEVIAKNGDTRAFSSILTPGNMYYRNIVTGTVDGAVGVSGGKRFIWFESQNGKLAVKNSFANEFSGEVNGSAAMAKDNLVLSVYDNGYYVYNPLTVNEQEITGLTRCYVKDVRLKGKASIRKDILVLTNAPNGWIYVLDISDAYNPYLIDYYETEQSIGIALIQEKFALIPARHNGIIKIDLYY